MKIFLRRATLEDVNGVASLFNDYRVFYEQPSDINVAHDFIMQRIEKGESVIFCAQNEVGE